MTDTATDIEKIFQEIQEYNRPAKRPGDISARDIQERFPELNYKQAVYRMKQLEATGRYKIVIVLDPETRRETSVLRKIEDNEG